LEIPLKKQARGRALHDAIRRCRVSPYAQTSMGIRTLTTAFALTLSASLGACGDAPSQSGTPADAGDSASPDGASGVDSGFEPGVDSGSDGPTNVTPSTDAGDAGDGSAPSPVKALGYYTGDQGSYDAITAFHTDLNMVSTDVYDVQTDGSLAGSDGLNALAHDKSFGIETFACISNYNNAIGDFDPALGHAALVTNKDTVIANAVKLAGTGFQGINIDFESLAYSANVADDRAAYSAFIHDLSGKLHAAGLKLLISVPAKTADSSTDTWSYPYDFATLAPDVDYLQLMTYDENGPGWSAPGPVSGADWVKTCIAYATSVVPPSKILIGLPAYGYDWDLTASMPASNKYVGTSVNWKNMAALLATAGAVTHWDAASSSPYVDYTAADGHKHEAWYENATSIEAKTKLVTQYALGGLSMWALGEEDASFWTAAYAGL
jgi:spore germination protein YaaH